MFSIGARANSIPTVERIIIHHEYQRYSKIKWLSFSIPRSPRSKLATLVIIGRPMKQIITPAEIILAVLFFTNTTKTYRAMIVASVIIGANTIPRGLKNRLSSVTPAKKTKVIHFFYLLFIF